MSEHPAAGRLRHIHRLATIECDWNLVAEVEQEMARLGIPVGIETTADRTPLETVVKRKPGRPRKVI